MREPKRPSDLLGGILRDVRSVAGRSEASQALEKAVGPDLAEHCQVVHQNGGRVIVEVDSAPLYSELQGFRREEIRHAMNERITGRKVTELTFRIGVARND